MSFESEMAGHIPAMRGFAYRLAGRRREDADDLVQEALAKALAGRSGFVGGNMRSWLFTILKNHFLNDLRKRELAREREPEVAASSPGVWASQVPEPPDARWSGRDVRESLIGMIPEFRDALVAVDVEGLAYKEAAERIGCPMGTIMSRLHRGRRALAGAAP